MHFHDLIVRLRETFPQPISDRLHDSYFVHTVMRALDAVDALKSERPLFGQRRPLDYGAAQSARLSSGPRPLEEVVRELVGYLEGSALWGHPGAQQNVVPPPTIASLVGFLLAGLANPNMSWDEYSQGLALAEVEAITLASELVGYDPAEAGGVFTFGGTGCTLYATRVGLEKALPGTMQEGLGGREAVLLASDVSHYCRYSVASWLGLGARSVVTVPTTPDNEIDLGQLEARAREELSAGKVLAAFVVTMGSTDAHGLDDLEAVVRLRDRLVEEFSLTYRPHVHADAVIGWAWAAFDDYDFEANPLCFRPRTLRALAAAHRRMRHLSLADSVGLDFHKTGFTPYVSSLVLFRRKSDLGLLARDPESMPYLYHHGHYRPGMYTLETSRGASGVLAALANLKLFGRQGLQALVGHQVEMAQWLREHLESHPQISVLNRTNVGPVTLFRVYPPEVDTFLAPGRELTDASYADRLLAHNDFNRAVFAVLQRDALEGGGVLLSLTDSYRSTSYGLPVVALKSYILSPFVDESRVEEVVRRVLAAQREVAPVLVGCRAG